MISSGTSRCLFRPPSAPRARAGILLIAGLFGLLIGNAVPALGRGFLLIQSDTENKIVYSLLPTFDESVANSQTADAVAPTLPLISDVASPRAMSLWSDGVASHWLYVWDATTQDLYKYQITANGDDTLSAARALEPVAQGLDVGALAVDNAQNVYYSNGEGGSLTKLPFTDRSASATLFSNNFNINGPKALTTDALYVYWGNSATGRASGSAVMAPTKQLPASQTIYPRQLTRNVAAADGVCASDNHLFYTSAKNVFVVRKNNTAPTENFKLVNENFVQASGCASDVARGAIYVADQTQGAVYELPANFQQLREILTLTKIAEMDGATELAVLRSAGQRSLVVGTAVFVGAVISWTCSFWGLMSVV
mmetsp:Transcript_2228/g.5282  ORF Transcript_2228/g.5282 Transcript_2228/m.5282 type:complete len:367 (-) Transcript_2228:337-1437(-)|eukprot:g3154.t1